MAGILVFDSEPVRTLQEPVGQDLVVVDTGRVTQLVLDGSRNADFAVITPGGPPGVPGPIGPMGPVGDIESIALPDLSLIFENGLV